MKKKTLFGLLLFTFVACCFTACSDDDSTPFTFYDDYYEVPMHGTRYVSLKTGHRNYTLEMEDWRVATVTVEDGSTDPNGVIILHGKLTGDTKLIITDNERNKKHILHVRVVNNYESFYPSKSFYEDRGTNHPLFLKVYQIFFINNLERDLLFIDRKPISQTDFELVFMHKGKYAFTKEGDEYYLTMWYVADEDGNLSDIAIEPEPHKFRITGWSDFLLHKLNMNLNLGWQTTPVTDDVDTGGGNIGYTMEMIEVDTEYRLSGSVPYESQLLEGILPR